jgi:hypothetical protein
MKRFNPWPLVAVVFCGLFWWLVFSILPKVMRFL